MLVGDVVGRTGRAALNKYAPQLKKEHGLDIVIVNGENAAGGKGLTRKALDELYHGGADIVTSGNHIWDKKEVMEFIDREPFLLRPANYPGEAPGHGYCVYPLKAKNIGVMNLSGRTFMNTLDCPFQKAEEILCELKKSSDIILLDFHAEATSEKIALGMYLDGRVQGVFGTHTHVPTADAQILPHGTAYVTDLGMVGAKNSVLGIKSELIIQKFLTARPVQFDVAGGAAVFHAVIVTFDDITNAACDIERVIITEKE